MIAEALPMTDGIEAAQDDCLERVICNAEQAAIEAHRTAIDAYSARARFLAGQAHDHLRQVREAGQGVIGTWHQNSDAAVTAKNRAWFAASYAREAGECARSARTLGKRLAQLEERWGAGMRELEA